MVGKRRSGGVNARVDDSNVVMHMMTTTLLITTGFISIGFSNLEDETLTTCNCGWVGGGSRLAVGSVGRLARSTEVVVGRGKVTRRMFKKNRRAERRSLI